MHYVRITFAALAAALTLTDIPSMAADSLFGTVGGSLSSISADGRQLYSAGIDGSVSFVGMKSSTTNVLGASGRSSYPSFPVFWIGGGVSAVFDGTQYRGFTACPEIGFWALINIGAGFRISTAERLENLPYVYASVPLPKTFGDRKEGDALMYLAPFVRIPLTVPLECEFGLLLKTMF
jgi:hypothetical protein